MIATLFVSNGQTKQHPAAFSPKTFNQVYLETLTINQDRFSNLDSIQIGDSVLMASKVVAGGREYWVADEPMDGKHDCIYRLVKKYMDNKLVTVPVEPKKDTVLAAVVAQADENIFTQKELPWWTWLLIALFVGGILYLFLRDQIAREKKMNPDNHQPVGGNVDALPIERTLTLLTRYLLPGEILINFRTGNLYNSIGKRKFKTDMDFGDSVIRQSWLYNGERVATAVIENSDGVRRVQHLRNACSNGFGNGSFALPRYWGINYDQTEEQGRVFTESDGQGGQRFIPTPTTPAPAPAVTPVPIPAPSAEMLTQLAHLAPKGTTKITLTYGDNNQTTSIKLEFEK